MASHPGASVLFRMQQARRLPAALLRDLRFTYDESASKVSPYGIAVVELRAPRG